MRAAIGPVTSIALLPARSLRVPPVEISRRGAANESALYSGTADGDMSVLTRRESFSFGSLILSDRNYLASLLSGNVPRRNAAGKAAMGTVSDRRLGETARPEGRKR